MGRKYKYSVKDKMNAVREYLSGTKVYNKFVKKLVCIMVAERKHHYDVNV